MRRRDFLSIAASGTAYSLFVRVDEPAAAAAEQSPATPQRSADDIRAELTRIAPPGDLPASAAERHMKRVDLACDVLVAGGGLAGVCAAVAAARGGAKVVLVQDRSRLGGNSSSEIKMHVVGANNHGGRPGWREGGLIEEFRLDDAAGNPQRSFRAVGLVALRQVRQRAEPDAAARHHPVCGPDAGTGKSNRSLARCDRTEHLYQHHRQAVLRLHRRQPAGTGGRRRDAASATNRATSLANRSPRSRPTATRRAAASCSPRATSAGRCRSCRRNGPAKSPTSISNSAASVPGNMAIGGSNGAARRTPSATTSGFASSCCRSCWACGTISRTRASTPPRPIGPSIGSACCPANAKPGGWSATTC